MSQQIIQKIVCDHCGAEIVTIYQREDGTRQLQLCQDLTLVLKARTFSEGPSGSITCSNCRYEIPFRLGLLSRYAQ
jgi:hypothetical protein